MNLEQARDEMALALRHFVAASPTLPRWASLTQLHRHYGAPDPKVAGRVATKFLDSFNDCLKGETFRVAGYLPAGARCTAALRLEAHQGRAA